MKTIHKHTDKEKFWRAQMTAAERFPGSQQEFCRSHGLSLNTFQYWRKKFNQERKNYELQVMKPSPFIEVEVSREAFPSRRLPISQTIFDIVVESYEKKNGCQKRKGLKCQP